MNSKTILLAESNPNDAALTLRVLEEARIQNQVVVAHDGVEALDYLFGVGDYAGLDNGSVPELVLLALVMPRLNGVDVLRHMRANERTKLVPALLLVPTTEQDTLDGYEPDGGIYVHKPLDFASLHEAIGRLNLSWRVTN